MADTHEQTADGQTVIYPWETPDDRLVTLNAMARSGAETSLLRSVTARILAPLGPQASDRAVLQALLDAIFALMAYRPDPASDQDWYQPVEVSLKPVPGNPISPITGHPKGIGDCEDSSVLFVALVTAAASLTGRPLTARVEWLSQPGKPQNHVAATARGADGVPLWAETTLPGARIGEHPYEALARLGGAEKIEGTYTPVNSSGDPAPQVIERDGHRLVYDPTRAVNGLVSGWAFPPVGLPFPVTITL